MSKFDLKGAREAGYSDTEILEGLATRQPDFNLKAAREAGYDDKTILEGLAQRDFRVTTTEKVKGAVSDLFSSDTPKTQQPAPEPEATEKPAAASGLTAFRGAGATGSWDEPVPAEVPRVRDAAPSAAKTAEDTVATEARKVVPVTVEPGQEVAWLEKNNPAALESIRRAGAQAADADIAQGAASLDRQVAQQDAENIAAAEDVKAGGWSANLKSGLYNASGGLYGALSATAAQLSPEGEKGYTAQKLLELSNAHKDWAKAIQTEASKQNFRDADSKLQWMADQFLLNAPSTATTLVSIFNPASAPYALGTMAAYSGGGHYTDLVNAGVDNRTATLAAVAYGSVEAAIERAVPIELGQEVLKRFRALDPLKQAQLGQRVVRGVAATGASGTAMLGAEGAEEWVTGLIQRSIDKAVKQDALNKGQTDVAAKVGNEDVYGVDEQINDFMGGVAGGAPVAGAVGAAGGHEAARSREGMLAGAMQQEVDQAGFAPLGGGPGAGGPGEADYRAAVDAAFKPAPAGGLTRAAKVAAQTGLTQQIEDQRAAIAAAELLDEEGGNADQGTDAALDQAGAAGRGADVEGSGGTALLQPSGDTARNDGHAGSPVGGNGSPVAAGITVKPDDSLTDDGIDIEETRIGLEVDRQDADTLREALERDVDPATNKPIHSEGRRIELATELEQLEISIANAEEYLGAQKKAAPKPAAPVTAPAAPVTAPAAPIARVGTTPNSGDDVTVKDGVVYLGKYPAQHFESGKDVRIEGEPTFEAVRDALRNAGALSNKQKVYPAAGQQAKPAAAPASSPTGVHYPNRKLGFEYARTDEKHDDNSRANIALANLKPGEKIVIGRGPENALTVDKVGAKAISFVDGNGKKVRYEVGSKRWDQFNRDVGGAILGHHHGVDTGDLVKALMRDPATVIEDGVIGLVDTDRRTPPVVERRTNLALRKKIDEMTLEEARVALRTDELTGIGNRRAWIEAEGSRAFIASIDADSLKWINDNMSQESGDVMLRAIGKTLAEEMPADAVFHVSGDEFIAHSDDRAELEAAMARTQARLADAVITIEKPDGSTIELKGVKFTYGIGATKNEADHTLKAEKLAKEQRGERAGRGEAPSGVTVRPAGAPQPAEGEQDLGREGSAQGEEGVTPSALAGTLAKAGKKSKKGKKPAFATPEQEQERADLISELDWYENVHPRRVKTADGKRHRAKKIAEVQKALKKLPAGMLTKEAVLALRDKPVAESPLVPTWIEGAEIALDGASSADEAIAHYKANGGQYITDDWFRHQFDQRAAAAHPEKKPSEADTFAEASRKAFLKAIKDMGGIKAKEAKDITGEPPHIANRMLPGLFRSDGNALDLIARRLNELGYLSDEDYNDVDGGVQVARDLIGEALAGNPVLTIEGQDRHRELLERENALQFEHGAQADAIAEAAADELADEIGDAALPADAIFELDDDAIPGFDDNAAPLDEAAAMRALGFTEEEIEEELNGRANQEAPAGDRGQTDEAVAQGQEGRAQAGDGQGQDEGFGLQAQTEGELADADRRRQQAAADKAKADAEADARAQADAERDSFTLTGSDRAADANPGQADIFGGQPAQFDPASAAKKRIAAADKVARAAGLVQSSQIDNVWRHPTRSDDLSLQANADRNNGDEFLLSRLGAGGFYEHSKHTNIADAERVLSQWLKEGLTDEQLREKIRFNLEPKNYGGRRTAAAIAGNIGNPKAPGNSLKPANIQPMLDAMTAAGEIRLVNGAYELTPAEAAAFPKDEADKARDLLKKKLGQQSEAPALAPELQARVDAVLEAYEREGMQEHADIIRAAMRSRPVAESEVAFWEEKQKSNIAKRRLIEGENAGKAEAIEPVLWTKADLFINDREVAQGNTVPDAVTDVVLNKINLLVKKLAAMGVRPEEVDTRFSQEAQTVKKGINEIAGQFGRYARLMHAIEKGYKRASPEKLAEAEAQLSKDIGVDLAALRQGNKLENATAPEHVTTGVDDRELGEIVDEFNGFQRRAIEDGEKITHVFDDPAKGEVVRLADKVKVYHKEHGWMTPAEARAKIAEWKKHAAAQGGSKAYDNGNAQRIVLSLFDLSGEWSKPWEEAGYQVFRFDIQDDPEVGDVNNFSTEFFNDWFGDFDGQDIYAVLAACPCTDFASSGARHFAAKDADGRTVASVKLVHQTLNVIEYFKPAVWAIENPVGRIESLTGLPPWRLSFDPNHLGDPYTKKTLLWGRFNGDLPVAPVEPTEGSKMHRLYGGKSQATKNARSVTPEGFAYAFFMANNAADHPAMAIANKYDRLDRGVIEDAVKRGVTEKQISEAVDDLYYMDLDDAAANGAIRALIPADPAPAAPDGGPSMNDEAAAWLKKYPIGTRVKIKRQDTTSGPSRLVGRTGVVTRGHFAGVYVTLDKTPRERTEKTELVLLGSGSTEIEAVADAGPAASPNKIFTEDAAAAARALLKKKLGGQLNSGIDPEVMQAGITLAGYHIEKGARSFAAFAKAMLEDLGDAVKPYLKSWYAAVSLDPRAAELKGMDSLADVQAADLDRLGDQRPATWEDQRKKATTSAEYELDAAVRRATDMRGWIADPKTGNPFKTVKAAETLQAQLPREEGEFAVYREGDGYYLRPLSSDKGVGAVDPGWVDREAAQQRMDERNPVVRTLPGKAGTEIHIVRNASPATGETTGYTVEMLDLDSGEYMPTLRQYKGDDALQKATDYAESIAAGNEDQGETDVTDQRGDTDLERDREDAAASNEVGQAGVRPGRGRDGGTGEQGVQGTDREGNADRGGQRLSGYEAAAAGKDGDFSPFAEAPGTVDSAAGSADDLGGGNLSLFGQAVEPQGTGATDRVATGGAALVEKRAAQARAQNVPVKPGDRANIDESLPFLLEAQRDDVAFAERRFAKPDGYGVLFTNGTGTGKTATGLGIIKRFERQGKTNTIIVVPSDKIMSDWIAFGKNLKLDITPLKDTKDAGRGIVITTYANFGQNPELAKRKWDLVVPDESHKLMQSADAKDTLALATLRAITLHPKGIFARRAMLYGNELAELKRLSKQIKSNSMILNNLDTMDEIVQSTAEENKKLEARADELRKFLDEKTEEIKAEVAAVQGAGRTRTLFLSATPFSYEKAVDYAEGYLFDYGPEDTSGGYNSGSASDRFMMQHFGYQMRTNKLNQPPKEVDRGLMQRNFNRWLKSQGVLSARVLDVPFDYDRKFVLTESAIGMRIDAAMQWISDRSRTFSQANRNNSYTNPYYRMHDALRENFDHQSRRYLLEAIKAREAVPIIREHLKLGRKVVVFHDFKKGGGFNPFVFKARTAAPDASPDTIENTRHWNRAVSEFNEQFRDLIESDIWQAGSPIAELTRAFPDALLFNGDIDPKKRIANAAMFQDDDSGRDIIIGQSDAMKEGASLHDTTGKHPRVLINLGLPTTPTTSIQQEGRIYRVGQASNAMFRYLNTGTNWERWAFATTIAQRSSAVENMALGEEARGLLSAYVEGFMESDAYPPGHEGEGTGGKERDRAAASELSAWDQAMAMYFAQQKKNAGTKAREGKDYFATPEPLGLKMVEWADIRPGESLLEPSAGHGAIARWMPENMEITLVEPSAELASRLKMVMAEKDARLLQERFEDLHTGANKFDAIVMNPPFGVGGSDAIPHVAKAAQHLRDGGRIVAIIPTGPAADKKFDKWFYEEEQRPLKPAIEHPRLGAIYRGDSVTTRAGWAPSGKVVRADKDGIWIKVDGRGHETLVHPDSFTAVEKTGPRTETFRPAANLYLAADIRLPAVTFERAGTSVATRVVVIDKQTDPNKAGMIQQVSRDYTSAEDIKEFFERIEEASIPPRTKEVADAAEIEAPARPGKKAKQAVDPAAAQAAAEKLGLEIVEYTTRKGKVIRGVVRTDLTKDQAKEIDEYTFKHLGGWFIREKHLAKPDDNAVNEPAAQYRVAEHDAPYTHDLFGEPLPAPKPATPKKAGKVDFGGTFGSKTKLVVENKRELGAARVNTIEEAAQAMAYLGRNAVERFDALVTDKNGKPLAIVGAFKGAISQTSVYPATIAGEAFMVEGAANIWFAHNHPSGLPTLSSADRNLNRVLMDVFRGSAITPRGLFAIAGNTEDARQWTFTDGNPGTDADYKLIDDFGTTAKPTATKKVPVVERVYEQMGFIGDPVTSPTIARDVARKVSDGKSGLIMLDAQNRPIAFVPVAAGDTMPLRDNGKMDALHRAIGTANAAAVIVVNQGDYSTEQAKNLATFAAKIDVRPLDVLDFAPASGAGVDSWMERGRDMTANTFFHRAGPFYSPLAKAIEDAPDKVFGSAKLLKSWLTANAPKLGVKKDEIVWSGIEEWLDLQGKNADGFVRELIADGAMLSPAQKKKIAANPGIASDKITRADVLAYLQGNGVQVEEVMLGETDVEQAAYDALEEYANENGLYFDFYSPGRPGYLIEPAADGSLSEADGAEVAYQGMAIEIAEALGLDYSASEAKFEDYQLPGGENYRELLLTLPERMVDVAAEDTAGWTVETVDDNEYTGQRHIVVYDAAGKQRLQRSGFRGTDAEAIADAAASIQRGERDEAARKVNFRSSHFSQPNILAHVRFNERTDADGKRVLFIEEIQSDWAQKGKKEGFKDGKERERIAKQIERESGYKVTPLTSIAKLEAAGVRPELVSAWEREFLNKHSAVPPAPFVTETKAWVALALKRMVAYAAENGFDRVAWTTGAQQAERYDLSTQVSRIAGKKSADGKYDVRVYGMDGLLADRRKEIEGKDLEGYIGKEISRRLIDEVESSGSADLTGLDLKVGGEGMKAFYDAIVPQVANDVLKKLGGGKVSPIKVRTDNEASGPFEVRDERGVVLATGTKEAMDGWVRVNGNVPWAKGAHVVERVDPTQPGFDITDAMRDKVKRDGVPLFQRNDGLTEPEAFRRMIRVQMVVNDIRKGWENAPEIVVVPDMQDPRVPQHMRDQDAEMKSNGATGEPRGFITGGRVYVIAGQHKTVEDVMETVAHEVLGHAGLRGLFGAELNPILRQIVALRRAEVDAKVKEYGFDPDSRRDLLAAAEEVLANFAQTRPEMGFVKRAVAAIRNWLRERGLKLKLTDEDIIAKYILPARRFIEGGGKPGGPGMGAAFSRQQAVPGTTVPQPPQLTRQPPLGVSGGFAGSQAAWSAPIDSAFDDFVYKFQNKHVDMKRVVQAVTQAAGQLADKWNPYLQEELFHGRAAKRVLDFVERELNPILKEAAKLGVTLDELDHHLHARHAEEANKLIAGRDPNMPDGGSGMKTADARAYFAGLTPEKRADLTRLADRVDAIIAGTRQLYVDYGLVDQDTATGWADMFKHYVPLMREDKDGAMGMGQGFSVRGREAKHRTGSTRAVVDILANIAMQRERAIVRGEKNRVAVALAGAAKLNPNPDFWTFDKVPTERVLNEQTGLVESRPDPRYKERPNVIVAKIRGRGGRVEERAIVFNEQNDRAMRMAEALKNIDITPLEGVVMPTFAAITRYMASINTQYNPVFGLVNLTRDLQTAALNLSSTPLKGQKARIMRDAFSALGGIYRDTRAERRGGQAGSRWAAEWEEFTREGGQTGYRDMFANGADRAKSLRRALDPTAWMDTKLGRIFTAGGALKVPLSVAQKGAGWLFDWLSDFNTTMENAVRLAAYKAAKEHGMTRQQAASLAKNLTVNFNRRGQIGQQAGALYAFFNAAMQGTARIGETMTKMEPGKPGTMRLSGAGAAIVTGGVLLGAMQTVLLALAGFDDDEPPEFVRERNLIIPLGPVTGKKNYVTIPMPLGFHVLPNIGRHAVEAARDGEPGRHAAEMMGILIEAFNPFGSAGLSLQTVMPSAFDPFVALAENKDWTGKRIYREDYGDELEPGFERAKDTASVIAKALAKWIHYATGGTDYAAGAVSPSPDQIDYLIAQFTGGVGRELGKAEQSVTAAFSGEELPAHKIPVVGRYYGSAEGMAGQAGQYYANLERARRHEKEVLGRLREGLEADDYYSKNPDADLWIEAKGFEKKIKALRREKLELIADKASREEVRAIEEEIAATMSEFNELAKEWRDE